MISESHCIIFALWFFCLSKIGVVHDVFFFPGIWEMKHINDILALNHTKIMRICASATDMQMTICVT